MFHIGILQHFWCEPAVEFESALLDAGHLITTVNLYKGEPVPSPDAFDGWLVMGGPMNVDETDQHAFLAPERRLLAELIARDRPVMGICLGSQLIARAAGARVYPRRPKEIGLFQVTPAPAAARDPLFSLLAGPTEVFQWHGDTFDLPGGATLLASSKRFPHQAFRLGRRVYAIQFHIECNLTIARQWVQTGAAELAEQAPEDDFAQYEARLEGALARQNALARQFIGRWTSLFDRPGESV
ncbi:MAG: type 1 glutamine amidotransferase [Phycisphaerae bacterium]|nr:type 1 glutamine amidotransferase [Phycisphaerae bacterium]